MTNGDKKRLKREKQQELFKLRDKYVRDMGYDIFPNFFQGKNPISYTYTKNNEASAFGWDTYESVLIHIEKIENIF